jgi:hypothetical protein
MDARTLRPFLAACALLSLGASYRTQYFVVTAPTAELAQEIGQYAEHYRRTLAVEWLGKELPAWSQPCPIQANVSPNLGAGGATQFAFHGNQPFDWAMTIQGSRERILDSVLPHEITHTIFATHFGRPLPRWADEGACTTVEHAAERQKQEQLLIQFLTTNRGIAFNQMFAMMEYPSDMLPLYSQGYALAQFFITQGGKQKFVRYVGEGMATNNWTAATRKYYGYESLSDLQVTWVEWIRHGRQTPVPAAFAKAPELQLAAAMQNVAENATVRQQSPDRPAPVQRAVAADDNSGWAGRAQPGSTAMVNASQPATDITPLTAVADNEQPAQGWKRYAPGSTARVGMIERTATRPQAMGQTQQQVLEWERSAPLDARVPTGTVLR